MMAVAENGGGLSTSVFHSVRRDSGTQNVVQPHVALHLSLCGGVGQDDAVVLILPGHRKTFWMQTADDLTWQALYTNCFSERVFRTEQLLAHSFSNNAHVGGVFHVLRRENGTVIQIQAFDREIFRGHPAVGSKPVLICIDRLNVIIHVRSNAFDKTYLIPYSCGIGHCESFSGMRACFYAVH